MLEYIRRYHLYPHQCVPQGGLHARPCSLPHIKGAIITFTVTATTIVFILIVSSSGIFLSSPPKSSFMNASITGLRIRVKSLTRTAEILVRLSHHKSIAPGMVKELSCRRLRLLSHQVPSTGTGTRPARLRSPIILSRDSNSLPETLRCMS